MQAKVMVHGRMTLHGERHLIVSTDDPKQIKSIPRADVAKRDKISSTHVMTNGFLVRDICGLEIIGAIPSVELDVSLVDVKSDEVVFDIFGAYQNMWRRPLNWGFSDICYRYTAHRLDMPICDIALPNKPQPQVRPIRKSFYEFRLEESRTKWQEEEASAPSRRAFEFL